MPYADAIESMKLFAREVLPAVHEMAAPLHAGALPGEGARVTDGEQCGPTDTPDDVDIPALREKYAAERGQAAAARGRRRSTWNSKATSPSSPRSTRTRR